MAMWVYLYNCPVVIYYCSFSLSPLGHCVLCKGVLSFVFQSFDFQVLCFGFCVLCPVLLKSAMETYKGSVKNGDVGILVRLSCFYLLLFFQLVPIGALCFV